MWSISEIVREIMKQSADRQEALASCARVARAISGPALEVLWEELIGVEHLFSLLKTSVKRIIGQDGETNLSYRHYVGTCFSFRHYCDYNALC